MKRFLTTLSVLVGFILLSSSVSAQEITNTGPNSNNTVNQTTNSDCTSQTSNQIDVNNSNDQSSQTGESDSNNNTNSEDTTTGESSNSSNTETNIEVNNSNNCVAQTQTEGGKGSGTVTTSTKVPAQVSKMPVGGVAAGSASSAEIGRASCRERV